MSSERRPWFRSRSGAVLLNVIVIAVFFLCFRSLTQVPKHA
jgi:hypothetical protein